MKLWSHAVAQIKIMHQKIEGDLQEALSRRYGSGALVVLPLASGKIAVFGPDRQLITICDDAPSSDDLRKWSQESEAKTRQQTVSTQHIAAADVDTDELGL